MRNSNDILQEIGLIAIEQDDAQAELRRCTIGSALDPDAKQKRETAAPLVELLKKLSEAKTILRTEFDATVKAEETEDALQEQDVRG